MNRGTLHSGLTVLLLVAFSFLLGGCSDDSTSPPIEDQATAHGVVLNSVDISMSLFEVDDPTTPVTIGLGPDGSPVGFAVRESTAAVPMGFVPALTVVDLATAEVTNTIALPAGSGATGIDFLDEDRVLVANPGLNSVVAVDLTTGAVGPEVPVGVYPQHVRTVGGQVFVLNALLGPDFLPTGPGTVTVLDAQTTEVVTTIQLSGRNPSTTALGPDGLLYVVHSGDFGQGNGALSVVDPATLEEVDFVEGFGEFPGSAGFGPAGNLHVGAFGFGIAVWSPGTASFVRAPAEGVAPEGTPSVSGLGFDAAGRLYALRPTCSGPSAALRLDVAYAVADEIPVGSCPIQIGFTAF